jgi:hemerythrin superfamily protein
LANTKQAKSRSGAAATREPGPQNDPTAQQTDVHARVKHLLHQYETLAKGEADESERQELATLICTELTAHATAEEEIFYPAVREAIDETGLVDEAEVEHATAKDLIAQIQASSPDDPLYDAKV